MKAEIKLKNPEYCFGCKVLVHDYLPEGTTCILGYLPEYEKTPCPLCDYHGHYKRPKKCIEENGL